MKEYSRRLHGRIVVEGVQIHRDPDGSYWLVDLGDGKSICLDTELEIAAYETNDKVRITIEFEGTPEL